MATTTIKLSKLTKERLDKLKEYKRETYEEILQKMLGILTICRTSPERARENLIALERKKRRSQNPLRLMKQRMKQKMQQRMPRSQMKPQQLSNQLQQISR
jgi:hypothetical protein